MILEDDIVICSKRAWRGEGVHWRGVKASRSDTEYMCVNEREKVESCEKNKRKRQLWQFKM